MDRRDYLLRSLWLAVAIGIPAGRVRSEEVPQEDRCGHTETEDESCFTRPDAPSEAPEEAPGEPPSGPPQGTRYMKSGEWARVEADGNVTFGISSSSDFGTPNFSQHSALHPPELVDAAYVELPNVGDRVEAGNPYAKVESPTATRDVYAPISGTVVAVNSALSDKPETVSEDPKGAGWLIVVTPEDMNQWNDLLTPDDLQEVLEAE